MSTQHKSKKGPLRNANLLMESRTFVLCQKNMFVTAVNKRNERTKFWATCEPCCTSPWNCSTGTFAMANVQQMSKQCVSCVSFKRCPAKKKLTTFGNITNKWIRRCSHMNLQNNKFPQGTHNLQYTVQYAVVFSMGFPRHLTCCNAFRCMWKLKRQGALEADGQRKSEKYQKKLM